MVAHVIAYTIGDSRTYDECLADVAYGVLPAFHKTGREDKYDGGSVWRDLDHVRAYVAHYGFAIGFPVGIYEIEVDDWERDTGEPTGDWQAKLPESVQWRALLRDAVIRRRVE